MGGLTAGPHLPVGAGPAASPSSAFACTGHGRRAAKPTRSGGMPPAGAVRRRGGTGPQPGRSGVAGARARWGGGARGMGGGTASAVAFRP